MEKELKLFVWENILVNYTDGIMVALAPDVETARKLLLKRCEWLDKSDLYREPNVYTEQVAFVVWGG